MFLVAATMKTDSITCDSFPNIDIVHSDSNLEDR